MPKRKKVVKRPRPAPEMREGEIATAAFVVAMKQSLNPLPEKKRAR